MPLGAANHLLEAEVAVADEAVEEIDPSVDILIAAGSGVICDLTKCMATALKKPFILCGTAPSMNAYTSITASLTEDGVKKSRYLQPADAVVLDVDMMAQAPLDMIRAGMGDLTARAICNADWMLSHLVRKTYFCPLPYQMTAASEQSYLKVATDIGRAELSAIHRLSEAILMSGYSMTILGGETSPSSGAEHVLSHFWDLQCKLRDVSKNLHGAQVAVGTVISLTLYDYVRGLDPRQIDPQVLARHRPSLDDVFAENRERYGNKAAIFDQVVRKKRIPDDRYEDYVRGVLDSWDGIWRAVFPYVSPVDNIREPLQEAGVPTTLKGINRTREDALEALLFGNRYRIRYTILDLAWELGIFPSAASEVLERAKVLT
jgi:glycerol-1-phosphate dehydrogenase [NAD(P)+]